MPSSSPSSLLEWQNVENINPYSLHRSILTIPRYLGSFEEGDEAYLKTMPASSDRLANGSSALPFAISGVYFN